MQFCKVNKKSRTFNFASPHLRNCVHEKKSTAILHACSNDSPCTQADFVPKTTFALKFQTGSIHTGTYMYSSCTVYLFFVSIKQLDYELEVSIVWLLSHIQHTTVTHTTLRKCQEVAVIMLKRTHYYYSLDTTEWIVSSAANQRTLFLVAC